jgi:hypothetical protein
MIPMSNIQAEGANAVPAPENQSLHEGMGAMQNMPHLGVGLGYRAPLHRDILVHADRIDFLEFIFDKYLYAPPENAVGAHRGES